MGRSRQEGEVGLRARFRCCRRPFPAGPLPHPACPSQGTGRSACLSRRSAAAGGGCWFRGPGGRDVASAIAVARHGDAGGAGEHDLPLGEPPAWAAEAAFHLWHPEPVPALVLAARPAHQPAPCMVVDRAEHGLGHSVPEIVRPSPVLSGCKTGIACVPAERAGRSGVSSSPTMVKGVAHVAGPRRQGSEQRRQRAPHLAEVLQKLSVKRFTATSCNGLRTPGEPRVFGLTSFAISRPSELTQRCSRQDRTSALIFFRASLLIAGRNAVNCTPSFRRASRGRNVNPKNVNDVCSAEPRRMLSLQYTILVLPG